MEKRKVLPLLFLSIILLIDRCGAIRVRVGHIGAVNAMPKAEAILEMCRRELWKEGILDGDFDIE
jgi:hypothetical protein